MDDRSLSVTILLISSVRSCCFKGVAIAGIKIFVLDAFDVCFTAISSLLGPSDVEVSVFILGSTVGSGKFSFLFLDRAESTFSIFTTKSSLFSTNVGCLFLSFGSLGLVGFTERSLLIRTVAIKSR